APATLTRRGVEPADPAAVPRTGDRKAPAARGGTGGPHRRDPGPCDSRPGIRHAGGMTTTSPAAGVLTRAAHAAGMAPSVHNTQPWRWRVFPEWLELYADRSRQLGRADPEGRLMTISCGAALHHARVALAAEGWE